MTNSSAGDTQVIIAGKVFDATQPIDWETAIEIGDFYFERARYLGLPQPTAAVLAENDDRPAILKIQGEYHMRFKNAEDRAALRLR